MRSLSVIALAINFGCLWAVRASGDDIAEQDLISAAIVTGNAGDVTELERTSAQVLSEEAAKKTGKKWTIQDHFPDTGWSIAISGKPGQSIGGRRAPLSNPANKPEGFSLMSDLSDPAHPVLWISGADARGALFGVGKLLRIIKLARGHAFIPGGLNLTSSPAYPIRGHQLGYRATANSYDAWSPAQFDQYIRELALFGSNSVEGIPFHDNRPTVNTYPRSKMNVDISKICQKYGQDYWLWVPADFDLRKADLRKKALDDQVMLFKGCPSVTAVFVPGGDPGDNPANLVIPYLAEMAKILQAHHPKAKVWLSMQGYKPADQDMVYKWIETEHPNWFGGLVAGPSSPPLPEMRARLIREYPIRDYPDITHSVRCQFPVPWWDVAYAVTLGRECVNPRPHFFSRVIHDTMPLTSGFVSYSDGIHDDFNKVVWSARAWDITADIEEIAQEYARLFFGESAIKSADGILSLEKNWEGPLKSNGGVTSTFELWSGLDKQHAELKSNWRWQLYLLRAAYDYYDRERLAYETNLEHKVNAFLIDADKLGSANAISKSMATLRMAESHPIRTDLQTKVGALCEDLWKSIGLQSSVAKYHASGAERGAVLDFLNYPLNNRWWLEDEMSKANLLPTETQKAAKLNEIARWEKPGVGSFYDAIGNVAKSPHEIRNEKLASPLIDVDNTNVPGFMMWLGNNALGRVRQTWLSYEQWPTGLKYTALDPNADYIVRTTGFGDCLLRVNGVRVSPTVDGRKVGEIKEFPIHRGIYREGVITLTFDQTFEPQINWREQSRLTEVWLIRTQSTANP